MKIDNSITQTTSGVFTSVALGFLRDSIGIMIPWLIVMFMVIITDLIAGVRKSIKFGVDVSPSTAFRETMGKMVTYFSFVFMVCLIDSAAEGNSNIARWCCLLIIAVEGGSIISNILKPHGIDISAASILKFIFMQTPLKPTKEEADDIIKESRLEKMRKKENDKWNHKKKN